MELHFAEPTDEDRLRKLENKATDIRKVLLGSLMLAKDIWKDELEHQREKSEIIKAIENAEEAFVDKSITDGFERVENVLNVIQKRAEGIYMLMAYLSRDKK